ncbi:MAG TPA: type I-U CRISPR-associated helicase/endonuclease Cas3, partial [Pirellulales bacterium]
LAGVPGYESSKALQELLDDYPLKPHELLSDRTDRVFKQLQRLAARLGEGADATPAWVIDEDETLSTTTLGEIVAKDKENLEGATLILSPKAGGLGSDGLLNGGEEPRGVEDVADELFDAGESLDDPRPRRLRVWSAEKVVAADHPDAPKIAKMRLVRTIDVAPDQNEADSEPSEGGAPPPRYWLWFERPASGDADGSKSSQTERPITWDHHTSDVEAHAKRLAAQLGLPSELGEAIELAARYHDLGKKRRLWQRSIGNLQPEPLLAKAGKGMKPSELNSYRHDFGSLLDLQKEAEFQRRAPEVQELILHLVAVHHGRARPHFSADEAFDPEYAQAEANRISVETPLRFARLQRRYGRWGLAYLESLLRAADAAASAHPSPEKAQ